MAEKLGQFYNSLFPLIGFAYNHQVNLSCCQVKLAWWRVWKKAVKTLKILSPCHQESPAHKRFLIKSTWQPCTKGIITIVVAIIINFIIIIIIKYLNGKIKTQRNYLFNEQCTSLC